MADEYEDRRSKQQQRAELIASLSPANKDVVSDNSSIPGQDFVDEKGKQKQGVGNNDGSESGGTAIPGGEIDLDSARQKFKALTGKPASAKWTAEHIQELIEKETLAQAPEVPVGEAAGSQTGPIVEGKTTTTDGN